MIAPKALTKIILYPGLDQLPYLISKRGNLHELFFKLLKLRLFPPSQNLHLIKKLFFNSLRSRVVILSIESF